MPRRSASRSIKIGSHGSRYVVRRSKSGKVRRNYLGTKSRSCKKSGKGKVHVGKRGGMYCVRRGRKVYL
jgi:hypothetical protein